MDAFAKTFEVLLEVSRVIFPQYPVDAGCGAHFRLKKPAASEN
jgi:hypothetical protein